LSPIRWETTWLIESSGINKGQIFAGARVSTKHVLALTNPGHASTKDILEFADFIAGTVERKFGVRLEREPVLVT
jgi:UDP-N-acetylmuramate dehydrogenase